MEEYDKEYISRIQNKAKKFRKISEWLGFKSAVVNEVDLSRFNGVIVKTGFDYVFYIEDHWYTKLFIIKDSETITIYVYAYEKNIIAKTEVSIETYEHVLQEDSNITKWLEGEEERKEKEKKERKFEQARRDTQKIVSQVDDAAKKKSFWKRMGL